MVGAFVAIAICVAVAFWVAWKKNKKWQRNASPASGGEHCLYSEERSEKPEDRL